MKFSNLLKLLPIIIVIFIQSCTRNASDDLSTSQTSLSQTEITIGGSVESYEILAVLSREYQEKSPNIKFNFLPNSQTSGGIQGVKDRLLDLGAVGRPLYEQERDNNIEYHALAENALVIVTHQSVGNVTNLTTEQLRKIYRGEIKNWQELGGNDAPIIIIDIPEDESEKKLLREHYLEKDLSITQDAILLTDEAQVLEAIATTEYSMGALPLSEEIDELSLTILSLNGIEPSRENLENGNYKMVQTLGMVFLSEIDPPLHDFVDFVLGEEGQNIIEEFTEDD